MSPSKAITTPQRSVYPLLLFAYLQALDLLSTLAFLVAGVAEGNPLIRTLMTLTGHPITALLWAKAFGIALGCYCWWLGKTRLLIIANAGYAGLIAWNLLALIVGMVRVS